MDDEEDDCPTKKFQTVDAVAAAYSPHIIQEGSREEGSKTMSISIEQEAPEEKGPPVKIEEPITRTLSVENPYKNEEGMNLSSDMGELTNVTQKAVKKKKIKSSNKQGPKLPSTMMSIKFNNAVIKISSGDLKSKKNLTGKNAEIIYNNEILGKYQGKIQKGLPHGYGVKTWPAGKSY